MATTSTPLQRAHALASRQLGAISSSQAHACGLTEHQLIRLVATGAWRRVMRGVFAVVGSADSAAQRAALAYLAVEPAGGVLSHVTAAAAHGLLPPSPLPHVTVPVGSSARCPIAKVHRSVLAPVDRAHRDGLVVTSVSRTLVDMAPVLSRVDLETLVDDAFVARRATASSVLDALSRSGRGRSGASVLRDVVAVWHDTIAPESVAETRLLRLLAELGFRDVVTQHEVRDEHGGYVARLDLAVPALRVGLEYDGRRHHGPRRWERDEHRYRRLEALGWHIASITKLDLSPGEPRLRELIAAWSGRRAA